MKSCIDRVREEIITYTAIPRKSQKVSKVNGACKTVCSFRKISIIRATG